jgi:hypothetical protein
VGLAWPSAISNCRVHQPLQSCNVCIGEFGGPGLKQKRRSALDPSPERCGRCGIFLFFVLQSAIKAVTRLFCVPSLTRSLKRDPPSLWPRSPDPRNSRRSPDSGFSMSPLFIAAFLKVFGINMVPGPGYKYRPLFYRIDQIWTNKLGPAWR